MECFRTNNVFDQLLHGFIFTPPQNDQQDLGHGSLLNTDCCLLNRLSTVARSIVLLKVPICIREHYCQKQVLAISNDIVVGYSQSCIHRYWGTQCTPGKGFPHHNSTTTSLQNCHLAIGIHLSCVLHHIQILPSIWWSRKESLEQPIFFQLSMKNLAIPWPTTSDFSVIPKALDGLMLLKPNLCKVSFVAHWDMLCDVPAMNLAVICHVVAFLLLWTVIATCLSHLSFISLFWPE